MYIVIIVRRRLMIKRVITIIKDISPLIIWGITTLALSIVAMNLLPIPFDELAQSALWLCFCFAIMIFTFCGTISLCFVKLLMKKTKKEE